MEKTMKTTILIGALALVAAGTVAFAATGAGVVPRSERSAFPTLDRQAQPFQTRFNEDTGKLRLVMYVSPTCGGCLRGADQSQKHILDRIDSDELSVYVVWAPKNGARVQHVERVTKLVTDDRATHYWDEYSAVAGPLDEMLKLTGPCAGTFMLYDRDARWEHGNPPKILYWEDAHALDWNRDGAPKFDAKGFADKIRELLEG